MGNRNISHNNSSSNNVLFCSIKIYKLKGMKIRFTSKLGSKMSIIRRMLNSTLYCRVYVKKYFDG